MYSLIVPRINDYKYDFKTLFSIWNDYQNLKNGKSEHFEFDFSRCDFLKQNAVAFLGGMISYIKLNGGTVELKIETLIPALRVNLEQNGFLYAMGVDAAPWDGNSIPYREDRSADYEEIARYLQNKWIGRGWLNIDPELAKAIVSNVLEIYSNAFTHSYSPNGVYSCGQNYPMLKKIKITVIDFGIGIPQSVRSYLQSLGQTDTILDEETLRLAFTKGFSTRPELGGLGLKLLKEFIQRNNGRLEVYSHGGYALIDASGEHYEGIGSFFTGTVVNISLNNDQKVYYRID